MDRDDIGDISLTQITREAEFENRDTSALPTEHHRAAERFEKAVRSAPEWLVDRWMIGQSPGQIARETGHSIRETYRMLKDMQKSIINETHN